MSSRNQLNCTYLLSDLDRVLYSSAPSWPEGTFQQSVEGFGYLILHLNVASPEVLAGAIAGMNGIAERFRLAISKRIGRPLAIKLVKSEEPDFGPVNQLSARDTLALSDDAVSTIAPREPPGVIEQMPEEAARWVMTLTEAQRFGAHPDEVMKRLYLLVEELSETHASHLNESQRNILRELKWVRDFVSHPTCGAAELCRFIASNLPSAVISKAQVKVRFDRTNVEHLNFVGRYDPLAREIVNVLMDAAIATL